jgi:hypothetical protein
MTSRRSSTGLQLPSGIQDREDRLLAYYINLISQQENEKESSERKSVTGKGKKSLGSDSASSVVSYDPLEDIPPPVPATTSAPLPLPQEMPPSIPVKRSVGRPRKHPREDVPSASITEKASPPLTPGVSPKLPTDRTSSLKKTLSAKELERAEAERIISTILERRPGRAEFHSDEPSEKKVSPKKKVVELVEEPVKKEDEPPVIEPTVPRGRGRPPSKKPIEEPPRAIPPARSKFVLASPLPKPRPSPRMEPLPLSGVNFFELEGDGWWRSPIELAPVGFGDALERELERLREEALVGPVKRFRATSFIPRVQGLP